MPSDEGDEALHLGGKQFGVRRGPFTVVGADRGPQGGVPPTRQVLQGPEAGGALGDHHVPGLEGVEDAAAGEQRVRRLVRIGVTFQDVALQVLDLAIELTEQLLPGRWGDEGVRIGPVEGRVAPGEPVRAVDRPGRVAAVLSPGVLGGADLRASSARTYQVSHLTP